MAFVPSTSVAASALSATGGTQAVCERRSAFSGGMPSRSSRAAAPATSTSRRSPRMVYGKTVVQTLAADPNFTVLMKLVAASNLDMEITNCTVFAPNNNTFSRLRPGLVDELMAKPVEAAAILARHVLPGKVLTSKQIKGCGFWENMPGGPLGYEGLGAIVRVGGARILNEACDLECDDGTIHTIDGLISSPAVKLTPIAQTFVPSIPQFGSSTVQAVYPTPGATTIASARAANACLPSTTGGRKAMGLVDQLPFWQYGPPYNAAKQEDYEPISIAQPEFGVGVDYQLMPPGSVIVTPDEVSAAKLLPVSGMSKYIGQTKRLVEGDGQSDYSRLDN